MEQPKCPNCGSKNVVLSADVNDVEFWIDENGNVDFESEEIRNKFWDILKFGSVVFECADCGEIGGYDEI